MLARGLLPKIHKTLKDMECYGADMSKVQGFCGAAAWRWLCEELTEQEQGYVYELRLMEWVELFGVEFKPDSELALHEIVFLPKEA